MSTADSTWVAIVNPAAGRGRASRAVPVLEAAMRDARLSVEVRPTERRGHATVLARAAVAAGYRKFLAVGGDGTVNEVANGLLADNPLPATELTLAAVPLGTGNDWARTHSIPKRVEAAVGLMREGRTVRHDVGIASCKRAGQPVRRYFVNMAGVGIDAHILDRLGEGKGGAWSYLVGLLGGIRSYRSPTLDVTGPDFRFHGRTLVIFMGPGQYCGGGLQIAPHAMVDDGNLHVTLVKHMGGWRILGNLPRLFNGTVLESPHVVSATLPAIDIASDIPVGVEVDGEVIGTTPARIEVVPRAIRVVTGR